MNILEKINPQQICSIKAIINEIDPWYVYKEAKIFLAFWHKPAGFWYTRTLEPYRVSIDKILSDGEHQIIEKQVFYKPYISIKMANGATHEVFFNNEEQLNQFLNLDPLKNIPWVKTYNIT